MKTPEQYVKDILDTNDPETLRVFSVAFEEYSESKVRALSDEIDELEAENERLKDPEQFRAFVNSTKLSRGDKDLLIGVFYDYVRQSSDE